MANRQGKQGFTLIEAAVAIAVVAILSGIIVPLVVKNLNDSRVARAKNDVQVIAAAVASLVKDTGSRPVGVAGVNWVSGPITAATSTAAMIPGNLTPTSATASTFVNLFNSAAAAGNTLFGTVANQEFSYRGPYLANDVSMKNDPWNHRYVILGFNAAGQTTNAPIYVLCAGPDGIFAAANPAAAGGQGPATGVWNTGAAGSLDDIYVRVN